MHIKLLTVLSSNDGQCPNIYKQKQNKNKIKTIFYYGTVEQAGAYSLT